MERHQKLLIPMHFCLCYNCNAQSEGGGIMAEFKITKIGYNPVTCVPDNFIETYMPAANGDYVKVYLYLLYCVKNGKMLSVASLADYFQCTESDITRALKYWESQDLLSMEELVSMAEPDTLAQTETSPSIPEKHGYTAAEMKAFKGRSSSAFHGSRSLPAKAADTYRYRNTAVFL